jgi:predicted nuclease of predicted toxin-antitoxin system
MKILLDANISWKLIHALTPIFGECAHVDFIGLEVPLEDIEIWNYALENEFVIITKDNDFVDLLDMHGFPPKVVLLKTGNNSSKALMELLINATHDIEELGNSSFGLLEIINKDNL